MFLTTKTYPGGLYMTQVHFTLNNEEVQSIIEHSVEGDTAKSILTTIFNQLDFCQERGHFFIEFLF